MLVEDDHRVGELIAGLLRKWRLEVALINSAEAAWQALAQGPVDMLIVDWKLPGLSGTELVQRIRKDKRLQTLPVLMISGQAAKEDIVVAIRTGINDYLAKPFKPEALKKKIAGVIQAQKKDAKPKAAAPADGGRGADAENPALETAEQICRVHIAGKWARVPWWF